MYLQFFGAALSACLWTLCYYRVLWRWKWEPEWSCRLVTATHGLLVTILAGVSWAVGPDPFTEPGGPNNFIQELTLSTSLGYFVFDTTWCLYYQTEGATMLIHHFLSLVSMTRRLVVGNSGCEFVAAICCFEITNPFLQARWFVRSSGYHHTLLYTLVEFAFMAMYFVFRIIISGYLFYTTFAHPRPNWELKIQALSFYAVSWVFWIFIVQYFVAKYIRKPRVKVEKGMNGDCKDSEVKNTVGRNGFSQEHVVEKSS